MNDGTARLSTLLVAASSLSSHYQDRTTSSNPYRLQSTTTWSRANRFHSLLQSRSTDPVQIREHGADSIGISSVTALQLRCPYQSTKPPQPNSVLGLGAFVAQHARLIKPKTTRQLLPSYYLAILWISASTAYSQYIYTRPSPAGFCL